MIIIFISFYRAPRYILLLEICPILNTMMDGIHRGSVTEEDEDAHFLMCLQIH